MPKKKVTRKELLNKPDEFITFSARALQWVAQNKDRILWGAAAVVLILMSISGWMVYQKTKEKNAAAAFGKIVMDFRQTQGDATSQEPMKKTKESLASFIKDYPNTGSGKMGKVMYANLCFETGDFDAALAAYQKAFEDFRDWPLMKNVILSGMGHVYLKKQDAEQASRFFEQIAAGDTPLLKDEALFILAKLSQKGESGGTTNEKFNQILSEFPESIYAPVIQEEVGPAGK